MELGPLYIDIHIFVLVSLKNISNQGIRYQVFLSDVNNNMVSDNYFYLIVVICAIVSYSRYILGTGAVVIPSE